MLTVTQKLCPSPVAPIVLLFLFVLIARSRAESFGGGGNESIIPGSEVPLTLHNHNSATLKRSHVTNIHDPVSYFLFNRRNNTWVRMPADGSVLKRLWIPRAALKILLHGYNGKVQREPAQVMESMMIIGREYGKKNESLNIILVDWTSLASRPILQYKEAAKNTQEAGIAVARYLVTLRAHGGFRRWIKLHFIGFSLGAHAAGIAGQEIQRLTGGRKVGRITGLDPAGPEFDQINQQLPSDPSGMLDKSDARYVDIIHCNMGAPLSNLVGAALVGKFGSGTQAGHSDFYPNGGERQGFQCDEIQDRTGCSHNMCALFYALSITVDLPGCPCNSWEFYSAGFCTCWTGGGGTAEYMGDSSNRRGTARGRYYLIVEKHVNVEYFLKI